jgi:hypothetical protein
VRRFNPTNSDAKKSLELVANGQKWGLIHTLIIYFFVIKFVELPHYNMQMKIVDTPEDYKNG